MTQGPFPRLGEFEILAPISEGGMGSVSLGRRVARPNELVALKVIRAEYGRNKEFVAMLVDEARLASRLSHPNILSTRALGEDGKQHFLVMELLRGRTLLDVSKAAHARAKRLPYEVVAWIGARIADALHYAHELADDAGLPLGVVHRDVNPANIFITQEGVPKLIDFGLAKARDRIASTAIGVVKGKLAYLAPEQAHGKPADRRSDVFALGVTLWETALDRRLFHDDSDVETIRRVREAEIPDPTTLVDGFPAALAGAINRGLARDPNDRWQTAAELRDALDAYVATTGQVVDAATVRALWTELFADAKPAAWEVVADEAAADQARTRVWDERKEAVHAEAGAPAFVPVQPSGGPPVALPRLVAIAGACTVVGALVAGLAVKACRGGGEAGAIEQRVARIEDLLGIVDGGPSAAGNVPAAVDGQAPVSLDDRSASCALAKIAAYRVWQDALARAKANAAPAEAACADIWSETKKQACYHSAMAQIRATQSARDAVIAGGPAAVDAVKAAKDDAKNEAIARGRAASQAAFAACGDEGE
jgi:eukaryotic-like serine/threonine-protein kinase